MGRVGDLMGQGIHGRVLGATGFQSPDRMRLGELLVGDATAVGALQNVHEAAPVVILPLVEAEHLLAKVGVKMEGTRSDIRSLERPLQARPKVFDVVGVNATFNVGHGVVNEFVNVGRASLAVRTQRVGVENGARQYVRVNLRQKRRSL